MLLSEADQESNMPGKHADRGIEVAIGPHPSRPDWQVLRVSYATRADHESRVAAALALLLNPRAGGRAVAGTNLDARRAESPDGQANAADR
jgi:hypothetical protein